MNRREFIASAAAAAATWCPGIAAGTFGLLARSRSAKVQAAARLPTVGWLSAGAQSGTLDAFKEGLRAHGYFVDQNILVDVRSPRRNESAEYRDLAAKLVARRVDVIFAANPLSLAAVASATNSIPIVGVDLESDPIEKNWVASLARPGGNMTGFFLDIPEICGKQLQFLAEVRPGLAHVAVLGDPRVNELQFQTIDGVARNVRLALQLNRATNSDEISRALTGPAIQGVDALVALTSPLVNINLRRVANAAAERRLPAICGFVPAFAEAGGLLAYGPDLLDLFRRAAGYVAAVLRGAAARDLPVQRPTKFQLVVNLKTAKALALAVPATLLATADRVIE